MSRLSDVNEKFINEFGLLLEAPRLFLDVLQRIIDSNIELFYRVRDFDSLELLESTIKGPRNNMLVMVNGQGLARYKLSTTTWVLAADDTTPIT